MAREIAKREILRLGALHDGQWYWYQIDRALSNRSPGCIGPFFTEIQELAAEGLIEIRRSHALAGGERYWLTEAGRAAMAK